MVFFYFFAFMDMEEMEANLMDPFSKSCIDS
jgi:hypothetical protein